MKSNEIILEGGRSAKSVVLIGGTVHRTKSTNFEFSSSLLKYLETKNFSYSPRFLGTDELGREKLSFIEGIVPREIILNTDQIIESIKILRQYHDIAADSDLRNNEETICHNDFAPWNIIFNKGVPVGIIDFDEAAPGKRIDDVAYFVWTFLDLGTSSETNANQIERICKLINVYDLRDKDNIVEAILRQQNRILDFRKNVLLTEVEEEKRVFSENAIINIQKGIQWINTNKRKIENSVINYHN